MHTHGEICTVASNMAVKKKDIKEKNCANKLSVKIQNPKINGNYINISTILYRGKSKQTITIF
jgi:hypothetical protein